VKKTYQTPMNSILTSTEKVFLNKLDCFQPSSLTVVNILYAKGTCWWLHAGRSPTFDDGGPELEPDLIFEIEEEA
jgi:hypothetical protein